MLGTNTAKNIIMQATQSGRVNVYKLSSSDPTVILKEEVHNKKENSFSDILYLEQSNSFLLACSRQNAIYKLYNNGHLKLIETGFYVRHYGYKSIRVSADEKLLYCSLSSFKLRIYKGLTERHSVDDFVDFPIEQNNGTISDYYPLKEEGCLVVLTHQTGILLFDKSRLPSG